MRVTSAQLKYPSGFTVLVEPNPESQSHLADFAENQKRKSTDFLTDSPHLSIRIPKTFWDRESSHARSCQGPFGPFMFLTFWDQM